jgi:hypothetical protein
MSVIAQEQGVFPLAGANPVGLAGTHRYLIPASAGLVAVVWFLLLSGWLGVAPDSVMMKRQNVLFNSDTNLWVDRMIGNARSPEQLVHPLEIPLWRGPCRALYHLLNTFLPAEYAGVLAARLLVAIVAGIGVASLAFLALHNGIRKLQVVLLFIVYLFFTSSSTISLPEHFGISNGLLSVTFVMPVVIASVRMRAIFLAAMGVLCGGTTITNLFFPLASFVHLSLKSMRAKLALIGAAIPMTAGAWWFLYTRSYTIHWFVGNYLNLRLLRDPLKAGVYAIFALFGPVISPSPLVLRVPGWDMVTYEPAHAPLQLNYYSWIQAIGVVAWVLLLSRCVLNGFREDRTRPYVWLLAGWIIFNAIFHNIWGDDFILYAPHWSWALMGLVLLGARNLSLRFVATMCVPILIGQISTLFAIKSALETITR